ncbi:hypothetical protein HUO13_10860 [Saccharopolyspora erythraea]|uniref:hypothetical protein n=1 Tax=Saccharopolyspora erythraea TaxID=1836 RepID=UPI001BAB4161|nr:hypothetical protein [Saccharopolyspora erythraea]QUH01243.1 hypothetical protein HUO13_10860 [Saccharopolyspora erythraea]
MAEEPGRDQVAEELRLLLEGLAVRAEDYLRGVREGGVPCEGSCGWCPVCAVVAIARGERPELTAKLADLVHVLREALAERTGHPPPEPAPQAATGTAPEPGDDDPDAAPKVQRIDVRRVGGRVFSENGAGSGC